MKHIAIAIDSNVGFLKQVGVMIFSLLKNNQNSPFTIHILHTTEAKELFELEREQLSHFVGNTQVVLQWYELSLKIIKKMDLPLYNNLPLTTYFRLLIPELLSEEIEMCLYMDGDMLIRGNIDPLFSIEVSPERRVAGVMTNVLRSYMDNLNITQYFNAGLLMFNLKAWRNNNVANNIISFITQYPQGLKGTQPIMGDQCGINYICSGRVLTLDPLRNTTPMRFNPDYIHGSGNSQLILGYDDHQINQAQQNPIILHFAGNNKPCDWICVHPRKLEYYHYLFESGFIDSLDFVKALWHTVTYPLRIDRPFYQWLRKLRNIVIKQ